MVGALRFLLANMVVLNHLFPPTYGKLGAQAVVVFYMISGYLMTRVLHETYGLSVGGIRRFLTNRALRIFPLYWLFTALTAMLIFLWPSTAKVNPAMVLPTDLYDVFRTLTLWDFVWADSRLVPPAWSLSVEFAFYILMPLALSRSKITATIWFFGSIAIHIGLLVAGVRFGLRYYPGYAASLFFSTGAMIYFYWDRLESIRIGKRGLLALIPLACLLPIIIEPLGLDPHSIGYYGSALLFVPVIVTLLAVKDSPWKATDRWLGDMAYPVFISHFLAGGTVAVALPFLGPTARLAFAWPLCLALSAIALAKVQHRIDAVRSSVRRELNPSHKGAIVAP